MTQSRRPRSSNQQTKTQLTKAQLTNTQPMKTRAKSKVASKSKSNQSKGLHPRNIHNQGYDFNALVSHTPQLAAFVRPNPYGNASIDFADPKAVKMLNLALLRLHYRLEYWDIPAGFLCPPIPGRVDYLHYLADLIGANGSKGKKTTKAMIRALDIGTGANGIYPILGVQSYGWQFVASDIEPKSLANVQRIIDNNVSLQGKIALRQQTNSKQIFKGVINPDDRFDVTLCNPPFHSSASEASQGSERKLKNLAANRQAKGRDVKRTANKPSLNFGGQQAELWCDGGEQRFLLDMITESQQFASQCLWFTSLVSKKDNLKSCYRTLERLGAASVKTIEMAQGNKLTRVLAWSFLEPSQQQVWQQYRC
ncbi:23S rRNA (adenine(1618)-N(6))-methyltransferase RlmF [Shewanella sp. Isolate11]|uniref:23S rRNA (adenine(1618)-N(6))-methyltransferase RlmF n=1 Tax=Shewanella sp. Isolate11 TaxID=2908530 RepID=UPI001EFDC9DE|nr:23S rRNA (adenine(1618)-N(6))-methyltransferase RlmF [Shewanella sp. Isolate11]MCG9698388.1 23S rRNA (adenine(1618)-N(6))-methyltransferase RlmF [Shewanella sp. Isolate11]